MNSVIEEAWFYFEELKIKMANSENLVKKP